MITNYLVHGECDVDQPFTRVTPMDGVRWPFPPRITFSMTGSEQLVAEIQAALAQSDLAVMSCLVVPFGNQTWIWTSWIWKSGIWKWISIFANGYGDGNQHIWLMVIKHGHRQSSFFLSLFFIGTSSTIGSCPVLITWDCFRHVEEHHVVDRKFNEKCKHHHCGVPRSPTFSPQVLASLPAPSRSRRRIPFRRSVGWRLGTSTLGNLQVMLVETPLKNWSLTFPTCLFVVSLKTTNFRLLHWYYWLLLYNISGCCSSQALKASLHVFFYPPTFQGSEEQLTDFHISMSLSPGEVIRVFWGGVGVGGFPSTCHSCHTFYLSSKHIIYHYILFIHWLIFFFWNVVCSEKIQSYYLCDLHNMFSNHNMINVNLQMIP